MPDHFVTVASYAWAPEAQLARNFLEAEGIPAFLAGEMSANAFTGVSNLGGEVQLQVREEDAPRAVSLLASAAAGVSLDDDWEAKAERSSICSLCGMALPPGQGTCPACGTSSEHITTGRGGDIRPSPRPSNPEGVKKSDQVQADAPRPALPGAAEETPESAPAGKGCAVLVLLPVLLWLLCR